MWISLENMLVELRFHENLLVRFHGKTVDMNGMHNLSNMIHSSLMAIRWLKSGWNGPKFEVEPLSAKDYSGLTKGMRLQAEADGKYWAAEVPGIPRGHVGEYPLLPSCWWVWSVTSQEFSVFGCPIKTWSRNSLIIFGAFPGPPVWLRMPRSWWLRRRKTRLRLWRSPSLATTSHFTRSVGNPPPPIGPSKSQRFTILGWEIY